MREQCPASRGNEIQRSIAERCLADIDNLIRSRQAAGGYPQEALEATHLNLVTGVKEAAMPFAISSPLHKYEGDNFYWDGRTPVELAESGLSYHQDPAALQRVQVEIGEAEDLQRTLRPGFLKIFFSPRMSRIDASYEVAQQEHLADEDMVRVHELVADETGAIQGKYMHSVMLRDIPLSAWVAMLRDPSNIFDRSFDIQDEHSALSVMQLYEHLEIPAERAPEGIVSVVESMLPYLEPETRYKIMEQLVVMRSSQDQQRMHEVAVSIADRWLAFEVELAESLWQERATPEIERFVFGLSHEWGPDTLLLLEEHELPDGGLRMSRELAIRIEKAKQNTLWTPAAVVSGNQDVLGQLDPGVARQIYENEVLIQRMMHEGYTAQQIAAMEAQANKTIAQQNVEVGGGCPGKGKADFNERRDNDPTDPRALESVTQDSETKLDFKPGKCRIERCPNRNKVTEVGPCRVCRNCQNIFDSGKHPNEVYPAVASGETNPDPKGKPIAGKLAVMLKLVIQQPGLAEVRQEDADEAQVLALSASSPATAASQKA